MCIRDSIYDQRERILNAEDLDVLFREMIGQEVEQLVTAHAIGHHSSVEDIREMLNAHTSAIGTESEETVRVEELEGHSEDEVTDALVADAETHYEQRLSEMPQDLRTRLLRWVMLQTTD